MIPWTKKYQPTKITEVVAQTTQISKIKSSLSPTKPIILYGPTGSGKTSIVYAIAKEKNIEILEINSSDVRNKNAINRIIGTSTQQQSLFFKSKVILIDDVDALSGRKDRGCIQQITKLLPKSKFPIVLTCTDPYGKKLSSIRRKTTLIELTSISTKQIVERLKFITDQEKIIAAEPDLRTIAENSKGDLRAAINDLQTNSFNNQLLLRTENDRDTKESVKYCLNMIFKSRKLQDVNNIFYKTEEDLDSCILWLDENLPKEYNSEELKKAYNYLSRADVFKGRIRRWQYWRFLVYINALITSGIAISKEKRPRPVTSYKPTTRILKLWQAKMRNAKRNSISEKIADFTHTSKKRAIKDAYPYLKTILNQKEVSQELNLSEDEINWINK